MSTLAERFRAGLRDGRLPMMECPSCGMVFLYPRHRCPSCHDAGPGWRDAEGGGLLHSFTVVRAVPPAGFEAQVPYALGVVKLDEGAQLLGRLVPHEGEWTAYRCDARVRFDPAATAASPAPDVPWFRLDPPA
jgi:uncharacterized protein